MSKLHFYDAMEAKVDEHSTAESIDIGGKANLDSDYEHVRIGTPKGVISSKYDLQVNDLIDHFWKYGYNSLPETGIDIDLMRHIKHFRVSLDIWEKTDIKKCFEKDELYIRSLEEKCAFTSYIKKCRHYSLQAKTSETNEAFAEEYVCENYVGYDSILSERNFPNWAEEVEDVKYAFLPTKRVDTEEFRKAVRRLFKDKNVTPGEADMYELVSMIKPSMMLDPKQGKTDLMRNLWTRDIEIKSGYYAKRTIVPVEAGGWRDTGIGDSRSILKVKILNLLARQISEQLDYSANAPSYLCNARMKRVAKCWSFLHLDFKKFGLTFPRSLMNVILEEIGKMYDIDMKPFLLDDFFLEIDGTTYRTERGTVLGWLDTINAIGVMALLHYARDKFNIPFDFINYNDDVEIGLPKIKAWREILEILRNSLCALFFDYDIPISIGKTYGSKAYVFLEQYVHYGTHYGLNMYKGQLTTRQFANAMMTQDKWDAKMNFASAWAWTKSDYIEDRMMSTISDQFHPYERSQPLFAGGYEIQLVNGMDLALRNAQFKFMCLGLAIRKYWTALDLSAPLKKHGTFEDLCLVVDKRTYNIAPDRHLLKYDISEEKKDLTNCLDDVIRELPHRIFELENLPKVQSALLSFWVPRLDSQILGLPDPVQEDKPEDYG